MSFKNGVLEGSGLEFGIPELDFRASRLRFWSLLGQNAKKAKNAKNACQAKTSITNVPRVGGRRCSPPRGVSITIEPAAHRRWCRACWTHHHTSCHTSCLTSPISSLLPISPTSWAFSPPLFFFPPEVAHSARPSQKNHLRLFGAFFCDFLAF